MNITVELSSELERDLANEASQLNLPLSEYILRLLSFRPPLPNQPKTGVELLVYWENAGVINSRSDVLDSQEHARLLRNQSEHRERA